MINSNDRNETKYFFNGFLNALDQLCLTQMAYWAKNHITISTSAAQFMTC